ncbi:MAG TPA: ABC transporter ATP-binding protein, partial [Chloroflexota bacterium]|nr:ABC transporter ATP-binding protein [Chloroflexota bacterium]
LAERFMGVLEKRLVEITAAIPTVEHFERPDYLRELELLSQNRGALAGIVNAVTTNGSVAIRIVTLAAILGTVHPLLLALPLFMVAPIFTETRARRRRLSLMDRLAESYRLERYFETLAVTPEPAREVRLFGLGPEIVKRFLALRAEENRQTDRERLIGSLLGTVGWLIFAAAYLGALFFVAQLVSTGHASLGDMVVAITVAVQLAFLAAQLAATGPWFLDTIKAGSRYAWLVDYAETVARQLAWPDRQPAPSVLQAGVTLDRVTFRYGESGRAALDAVSMTLPAGSIVAVVGENGAGKSTLVKLLSRMYEPSSGRILVDGIDLRALDVEEWRRHQSAGFQDFMRFEFLAGEAVGVGDLPHIADGPALELALVRAGATDVVAALPGGLHTQLGRNFDGAELSGGQWQKMALGRAMMRPAPLLVLLDEPTAALDAEAEFALFQRYASAARDAGRRTGAITVLVTHRFSNVRMADLILVLAGGRLVEHGSHEHLIAAGGLYAELYELQARQYR